MGAARAPRLADAALIVAKETSASDQVGGEPAFDRVAALNHLLKLHNRLMVPFTTHLEKRHRITVNEFRVLMLIGELGPCASHELAVALGVNTMAVSRAVAALSAHGRIHVEVDPQSRRRKLLRLTGEGERLFAEMLPSTLRAADYLFAALRPHEAVAFNGFVETLIAQLEAEDADGRSVFLERTRPEGHDASLDG